METAPTTEEAIPEPKEEQEQPATEVNRAQAASNDLNVNQINELKERLEKLEAEKQALVFYTFRMSQCESLMSLFRLPLTNTT